MYEIVLLVGLFYIFHIKGKRFEQIRWGVWLPWAYFRPVPADYVQTAVKQLLLQLPHTYLALSVSGALSISGSLSSTSSLAPFLVLFSYNKSIAPELPKSKFFFIYYFLLSLVNKAYINPYVTAKSNTILNQRKAIFFL